MFNLYNANMLGIITAQEDVKHEEQYPTEDFLVQVQNTPPVKNSHVDSLQAYSEMYIKIL